MPMFLEIYHCATLELHNSGLVPASIIGFKGHVRAELMRPRDIQLVSFLEGHGSECSVEFLKVVFGILQLMLNPGIDIYFFQ